MKLYFDKNAGYFVSRPGTTDQLGSIELKRGDTTSIQVVFCEGSTQVELGGDAAGELGVKPFGKYDDDFVANAPSWVKTGTGVATIYTFALNTNTQGINDQLGEGTSNVLKSVDLMMEMEWTEGGALTSSNTLTLTIVNDVIKGGEAGAVDITPGTPVQGHQAVQATGTINFGSNPSAGNTFTIGSRTYTFRAAAAATGEITLGATLADTIAHCETAVSDGDAHNTPNPDAGAAGVDDEELSVQALVGGVAGNSIPIAVSGFGSVSGAHLTGGSDLVPGTAAAPGALKFDDSYLYVRTAFFNGAYTWKRAALNSY